jgi:hypothetical protein
MTRLTNAFDSDADTELNRYRYRIATVSVVSDKSIGR